MDFDQTVPHIMRLLPAIDWQIGKLHFVVDVDIKGFFDNVNHSKLLRQMWTIGIRDKWLLGIIRSMLNAPIVLPTGKVEHPKKVYLKVVSYPFTI